MPLYAAQVSMWDNSESLPRDAAVNTLWFDDHGVGTDPQGLADDLAGIYDTNLGRSTPIRVQLYDQADPEPRRPVATSWLHQGATGTQASIPREIALCLSFYSGQNVPRRRGRIYLPVYLMASAAMARRPSADTRAAALAFATNPNHSFPDLGGADVSWVTHSRTGGGTNEVSAGWVDNEWDTMRSRGLRADTRDSFARQG